MPKPKGGPTAKAKPKGSSKAKRPKPKPKNKSADSTKGTECFAACCTNYRNPDTRKKGLSFHVFPDRDNDKRFDEWVRNCRRVISPGAKSVLCSCHFEDKWLDRTGQTTRLREGAVPTLFDFPEHLQSAPAKQRLTKNSLRALEEEVPGKNGSSNNDDPLQMVVSADHVYSGSPSKWKRKLRETEERLQETTRKLRNAERREKRAKDTCRQQVQDLFELNLINVELKRKLDSFGDIPWSLFKRDTKCYTEEQKDFAVSLHLQSPKAYEYVRSIGLPLPHPRTLQKWMQSVDGKPGLNKAMLQVLAEKRLKFPEEYTRCCLMLDGMSIRRQVEYNHHSETWSGYVDLGSGPDCTKYASEALVFMIVGLNGKWKAPIGYVFTNTLTAETQAEIIKHYIEQLDQHGFEVHAITMDGHATNVGMASLLGAQLDPLHTGYNVAIKVLPHQVHQTYVFLDVCHMIKLLRNTWAAFSAIRSEGGDLSWEAIQGGQKKTLHL